jgi:hypothetical protein
MKILKPADVENEARLALNNYFDVYVRPLPEKFTLPCLLITTAGGRSENTIDTFTLRIDARAKTDAEAYEYLTAAVGALEEQARQQATAIRNVTINSLTSWGSDPARPDLKLCTATLLVTAHRESLTIPES